MPQRLKRSSRSRWQQHIDAQVVSGLSQAAYCREHQLNEKYFSLWKGKNPLTYMTYLLSNVRNKAITLFMPHEFDQSNITQFG